MVGTITTMFSWSGERQRLCFISDLRGKSFSVTPLSMIFVCFVDLLNWESILLFLGCSEFLSWISIELFWLLLVHLSNVFYCHQVIPSIPLWSYSNIPTLWVICTFLFCLSNLLIFSICLYSPFLKISFPFTNLDLSLHFFFWFK